MSLFRDLSSKILSIRKQIFNYFNPDHKCNECCVLQVIVKKPIKKVVVRKKRMTRIKKKVE